MYFFYITNDWDSTPEEIVFSANDRCQQENVLAQLNAVRALHAPLDNLISNNAYMLITSLAWNLKAWLALSLPEPCGFGKEKQAEQKRGLLMMEFRTFVNSLMRVPAASFTSGRRWVIRLLAWKRWQPQVLKLAARLTERRPAATLISASPPMGRMTDARAGISKREFGRSRPPRQQTQKENIQFATEQNLNCTC